MGTFLLTAGISVLCIYLVFQLVISNPCETTVGIMIDRASEGVRRHKEKVFVILFYVDRCKTKFAVGKVAERG